MTVSEFLSAEIGECPVCGADILMNGVTPEGVKSIIEGRCLGDHCKRWWKITTHVEED